MDINQIYSIQLEETLKEFSHKINHVRGKNNLTEEREEIPEGDPYYEHKRREERST